MSITDMINLSASTDQTVFKDKHDQVVDRSKYLTASAAGKCLRMAAFEKQGTVPDNDFQQGWGFATRGHSVEAWFMAELHKTTRVWSAGDMQTTLIDGNVAGTPDGYCQPNKPGPVILLEVKSFDPRSNTSNFPRPEHVTQVQINMELSAADYDSEIEGRLIYVNASNFEDIHEFAIARDKAVMDRARFDAQMVLEADTATVPVDTDHCKYCPFKGSCDDARVAAPVEGVSSATSKLLDQLGVDKSATKIAAAAIKKEEGSLKKWMLANDRDFIETKRFTASLSTVSGRVSTDLKKAEEAGLDLSPFQTKGADSQRLTIKAKGTK